MFCKNKITVKCTILLLKNGFNTLQQETINIGNSVAECKLQSIERL